MSAVNSTRKPKLKKPSKDFPLGIHKATGYWRKKVKGRVYYFGKVSSDPKGAKALKEWLEVKDDLLAGREPRKRTEGLTVADLCNKFLTYKAVLRDNRELSPRTFQGYHTACTTLVKTLGKSRTVADLVSSDFAKLRAVLAKTRSAVSLRSEMQKYKTIFKFAFDDGLILHPVLFGRSFDPPRLTLVRRDKQARKATNGEKVFGADEIRSVLGKADPILKAMVLLGINCGFGNSDISHLPKKAVDLDAAWVNYPRPKTHVDRKIPLWKETIKALEKAIAIRPKARDSADNDLVFLTNVGGRWVTVSEAGHPMDLVSRRLNPVLQELGLKRPGVSFYGLRHTLATVAGETTDADAIRAVLGHNDASMLGHYTHGVSDERLLAVTNHVRGWLFGEEDKG